MEPYLVNALFGKELKVSIGEISGATMIYRNSTGDVTGYGGYHYEELSWLALRLNFSLDMKPQKDINFGTLINGSWTGMIGEIQRKEVDIICTGLAGLSTYDFMDMAIYTGAAGFGLLTKYPKPETSIYGHVMPFSLHIWICLLFSILACIGCIKLITVFEEKYLSQQRNTNDNVISAGLTSMSKIVIYIYATLTNHGGHYQNKSRRYALGMVAFTWCLATFFIVKIYSSCLASYLSLTFQRPDINSFKDLADNPNYHLVTVEGSAGESALLRAQSGLMKEIGDRLRGCPKGLCRVNNFGKIAEKVLGGNNTVGLTVTTLADNAILKTMEKHECRLTRAQEKMAVNHYFMGAQKKSPYTSLLFKESIWYHAFGLRNYWESKMVPKTTRCNLQYGKHGESVHLVDRARFKLNQFYLAFAVLFAGYALAFIQFLRERLNRRAGG